MSEIITAPQENTNYSIRHPILFMGPEGRTPEQQAALRENRQFIQEQLPPDIPDSTPWLTELAIEACARALTETDRLYGRDTGSLGALQLATPQSPWKRYAMLTYYHDGTGGRQAIAGTTDYMNYKDALAKEDGKCPPYGTMLSRCIALAAATFDDIIYGYEGRKTEEKVRNGQTWDEAESAKLAIAVLQHLFQSENLSADADADVWENFIKAVDVCIEASTFDEKSGKQMVGHSQLALNEQAASVGGDLWPLGTRHSGINTMLLSFENLWKWDTADKFRRILRGVVRYEALRRQDPEMRHNWIPLTANELIHIIDERAALRYRVGKFLQDNGEQFILKHSYNDADVDALMRAGKEQNAILQQHVGTAIMNGMKVRQALHCFVSYAHARPGQPFSAHTLPRSLSPGLISDTLLARQDIELIRQPVDAKAFFDFYQRVDDSQGLIIPLPHQRGSSASAASQLAVS